MEALKSKQTELRVLDGAIAERKRYHRQQETIITEMVERGNTQLMGLVHDIAVAKQELRSIKTDIRTAAQDKVLLNEDLEQIRMEISLTVVQTVFIGAAPSFG